MFQYSIITEIHFIIEYACETITEVIEKIRTRNKHIKIADGSEGGWETVRLYESNPVK